MLKKGILSAILLVWLGQVLASPSAKLQAHLENLRTFQADFVQTITRTNGLTPAKTEGSIAIKKPDWVRWQVDRPEKQVYIADGKTLWQIDYFLEQVLKTPLKQTLSQAPILLLSQPSVALAKSFQVSEPESGVFILKPLTDSSVQLVKLTFDRDNHLAQMQLLSTMGQSTTIQFSHEVLNAAVSDDLFKVVIPKGFAS